MAKNILTRSVKLLIQKGVEAHFVMTAINGEITYFVTQTLFVSTARDEKQSLNFFLYLKLAFCEWKLMYY
jgi:hypothetical protein